MLLEFAISVGVLWLIAAAALEFGRAYLASHVLQTAARTAARELALDANVAWNASFQDALGNVFDPDYLVIDAQCLDQRALEADRTPGEHFAIVLSNAGPAGGGLILNQMLRPLMIMERVDVDGAQRQLLRYPGALMTSNDPPPLGEKWECIEREYAVGIPEIDDERARIVFHPVVEEIEEGPYFPLDAEVGGFVQPGTVALRIHYPFQASTMSNWRLVGGINETVDSVDTEGYLDDEDSLAAVDAEPIDELDTLTADGALRAYALTETGHHIPVYGGRLGLGEMQLLNRSVRPFRRVLSAQAVAPREVVGL